jgi:protein kinase C substrate 80K-H
VRDGLCEVECCDGSDEAPGVCPNKCKEIGAEYRKKRDAELKIQREGAKIRSTYIAYAHQEKKRLEAEVKALDEQIAEKEKDVQRLKDIADRTESLTQAALDEKKKSPLYLSLVEHSKALRALKREHDKHVEREAALGQILDSLRTGYNPNYQDMAVLEAVRGWEELAGLPHINDVGKDNTETPAETKTEEATDNSDDEDYESWTKDQIDSQLDSLLYTDYVSLMLEHEEHIQAPLEGSLLFDIASYLPDSLVPVYDEFKDGVVSCLQKIGIVSGDSSAADSSKAQQAYNEANNEVERLKVERDNAENDSKEIFNVHGFGAKGEWKKLDGHCMEKDTGDYTYEVCLFNEIKQKPNHGGTTFSLGKFDSWNPSTDVQPGDADFYKKQTYKAGTRCWNGPERNTQLLLTCGPENKLLTIQELEKCEYEITGTTPALCLPVEGDKKKTKDEL